MRGSEHTEEFRAGIIVACIALFLFGADLVRRFGGGTKTPTAERRLVVDPNVAPLEVLLALPSVGPVLAGKIVTERERRPFESLEDLDRRVDGVGPATMAALSPHLHVVGP